MDELSGAEHLERCLGRVGCVVLAFFYTWEKGTYRANDLANYASEVLDQKIANETATRCMRALRKEGRLNYDCINHGQSIFVMLSVGDRIFANEIIRRSNRNGNGIR